MVFMSFFKKKAKDMPKIQTDKFEPVLRSSICTGEKVAGFRDRETGRFTEVALLRSEGDLAAFRQKYGITEDMPTIY